MVGTGAEINTHSRVIHRADYHEVLMNEAKRLGVEILLNAKVAEVDFDSNLVTVEDGRAFGADVVVGADGTFAQVPY